VQECDRLEAQLQTALQASSQQPSPDAVEALNDDLASLRQQLTSSEERVHSFEQDLQVNENLHMGVCMSTPKHTARVT